MPRAARIPLGAWPRGLSRGQAAAYAGVSENKFLAEVEEGLWPTRGRIRHYWGYGEPVPEHRQVQFYHILRKIIEAWEENLAAVEADPKKFEKGLVTEAVPVARATVKACRKILAAEAKRLRMTA